MLVFLYSTISFPLLFSVIKIVPFAAEYYCLGIWSANLQVYMDGFFIFLSTSSEI